MAGSTQDPNVVDPGNSTYSLRTPDSVKAADVPTMPMERVLPRQTSTGLARGIQQLGSPNVYVDSGNEQIIVAKDVGSNTSNPNVLMGNQTTFGEGFYVTKPGIDVTTAKSNNDFIFNSNQNVFKIVKSDAFTISSQGSLSKSAVGVYQQSSSLVTIPHNLGYTPALISFVGNSGGYSPQLQPTTYVFASGGAYYGQETVYSSVDTVNIYFYTVQILWILVAGLATLPASTYPIKYYLLQESAS